jgi:hypothetical protein
LYRIAAVASRNAVCPGSQQILSKRGSLEQIKSGTIAINVHVLNRLDATSAALWTRSDSHGTIQQEEITELRRPAYSASPQWTDPENPSTLDVGTRYLDQHNIILAD